MPTRTQQAARRSYDLGRRKQAERHPLVAAVLAAFPGAEVIEVRGPSDARSERGAVSEAITGGKPVMKSEPAITRRL